VFVADFRPDSATFGLWTSFNVAASPGETWVAPEGFALGWQAVSEYALVETGCSAGHYFVAPDDDDCAFDWPEPVGKLVGVEEHDAGPTANDAHQCLGPTTLDWWADEQERFSADKEDKHSVAPAPTPRSYALQSASEVVCEVDEANGAVHAKPRLLASDRAPSKPTILVFGSTGQLGKDLCKYFRQIGQVIGACKAPASSSVFPIPMKVDLGRPASIRDVIRRTRPTLVVNAAAMTNVDAVEAAPRLAQSVNANAPSIMAAEAAKVGAAMLHFCTDKVFSGKGERPWKESDDTAPMNQYGLTKLRGTEAVLAANCPSMVIRTGWLYSSHGNNFVQNLIDLMTYRSSIALAKDGYGSPTSTDWLARTVVNQLAGPVRRGGLGDWMAASGGLYHLATLGYANRLEVGDFIASLCRQHCVPIVAQLKGSRLSDLSQTPTPENCRLDISKFATSFQIQPPTWQDELSRQVGLLVGASDAQLLSIA
jgi:dTDP-4-dehydrorhamnose reductase